MISRCCSSSHFITVIYLELLSWCFSVVRAVWWDNKMLSNYRNHFIGLCIGGSSLLFRKMLLQGFLNSCFSVSRMICDTSAWWWVEKTKLDNDRSRRRSVSTPAQRWDLQLKINKMLVFKNLNKTQKNWATVTLRISGTNMQWTCWPWGHVFCSAVQKKSTKVCSHLGNFHKTLKQPLKLFGLNAPVLCCSNA